MNLLENINNSGFNIFFLVVDKWLSIELAELNNFRYIDSRDYGNEINSGQLLDNPKVKDLISKVGGKVAIMPFKPSGKIEKICENMGWRMIANPASLNRELEDKIKFVELAKRYGWPIMECAVGELNEEVFGQMQSKYGNKLVLQTHFGWAGKSTFVADSYEKALLSLNEGVLVRYSPFKNGITLLNNACIVNNGVVFSNPALQFTGIKELTNNPFTTVGRQWPSTLSADIENKINEITQKFGNDIRSMGYKGYFGLDFFVVDNEVFILECNPRLTASFAFYDQLEKKQGLNRLILMHIASFLDLDQEIDVDYENNERREKLVVGSELVKKNSFSQTTKKYNSYEKISDDAKNININQAILSQLE